uniref:C-type lectin domain-containing protein n=1 Tax=Parascaris univalens TaxID=6257 RepID=A0A915AJH1_PARUN
MGQMVKRKNYVSSISRICIFRRNQDFKRRFSMLPILLLYGYIGSALATFCIPGSKIPRSQLEYACQVLPYRTFFVGGRCFIAVTSTIPLQNPCGRAFMKHSLSTSPKLAIIDSEELLLALKQSNSFDPGKSYRVSMNTDGSQVFMARHPTSGYNYLCEVGGKETCPPGYEMWRGSCYRFFGDPKPFEEAIEICSQISAFSSMATIDDESTNRFLANYARSFATSNDGTEDTAWLGEAYVDGGYWADVKDFNANDKISFYRWFSTSNGMYTQSTNHPAATNNAIYLYTTTGDGGNAWFGYWGTADGGKYRKPFFCERKPIQGARNPQIRPIKPGAPIFPAAEDVLPEQTTPESDIELLMPDSSEAPDSDVKAPRRKLMQPTAGKSDRNGGNPEEEALCEILIPPANSFYEALLKMTNRVDTFLASITNDADKCKTIFKKLDDLGSSCDALRNRAAGASAAC